MHTKNLEFLNFLCGLKEVDQQISVNMPFPAESRYFKIEPAPDTELAAEYAIGGAPFVYVRGKHEMYFWNLSYFYPRIYMEKYVDGNHKFTLDSTVRNLRDILMQSGTLQVFDARIESWDFQWSRLFIVCLSPFQLKNIAEITLLERVSACPDFILDTFVHMESGYKLFPDLRVSFP